MEEHRVLTASIRFEPPVFGAGVQEFIVLGSGGLCLDRDRSILWGDNQEVKMKRLNAEGFSMIELLTVLLIIGVLAAIAAPLFTSNTSKAKTSEAVSGMGAIRSGERTYYSQYATYLAVAAGSGATYFGTGTGNSSGTLGVQIHGNRYYSPEAYSVSTTATTFSNGTTAQDFVITADGSKSDCLVAGCGGAGTNTTDGARNAGDVYGNGSSTCFQAQMDNSGYVVYSTNCGSSWQAY